MKKTIFGLLTISLLVALSSCGKVPQAEIDAAKLAVDSARMAGADVFLPEAFTALEDSLNGVIEAIEAQKSKFFRKFDDSKEQLTGITGLANTVITDTEAKKEAVREDIQTLLAQVSTLQEENKKLVTQVPKGKDATAVEAINADITAIDTAVAEANELFNNNDLLGSLEKVKAGNEKAMAINNELKEVLAKYSRFKK